MPDIDKITLTVSISLETMQTLLDLTRHFQKQWREELGDQDNWTVDLVVEYALDQLCEHYQEELDAEKTTDPQP